LTGFQNVVSEALVTAALTNKIRRKGTVIACFGDLYPVDLCFSGSLTMFKVYNVMEQKS